MRSTGWPVSSAIRPSTVSTMCRRSLAWISISAALPPMPAEPRCMRMRACGSANRLPLVPAESRNCPALQASPSASVETSHGTSRMTSRMASMDGTDPQGDVGAGILGGEREQLRREQRSVVVIEHAVEHEYPRKQQLLPLECAEDRGLFVVSHASTLRHGCR